MKITGFTILVDNGAHVRIDLQPPNLAIVSPGGSMFEVSNPEEVKEFCELSLTTILMIVQELAQEESGAQDGDPQDKTPDNVIPFPSPNERSPEEVH